MPPAIVHALIAVVPVLFCLAVFQALDVFKLLSLLEIAGLLAGGAVLAAGAYLANGGVLDAFPMRFDDYSRFMAPVVEEIMKGALLAVLFALNRMGYLIDAAITGFAVGAGFSVAENLLYVHQFAGATLGVWMVRGFGTAIMHGGAAAIFSVLAVVLYAPRLRASAETFRLDPLLFLPGLVAAVLLHGAFNQFGDAPLIAMTIVIVVVPTSLLAIFALGETRAHRWLAQDKRAHARLLADIGAGAFKETADGGALMALAARLGPERGADLLDYVRINAELVVGAEEALLALEEHRHLALPSEVRDRFTRLHLLERRLGRAPVMAVRQHLRFSRDDLWKMHELEKDTARKGL